MEGRPIDTIGYRGMHSYELALEDWWVPADHLIGGDEGLGRGFYYQMEGFENGRLQTAARALGVMQAAYEAALDYARNRTRVRLEHRRVPADAGQARPDGRADPGRPAVQLPRRHADGQGAGRHRGQHGQGLRVQGRRVGHPRGDADPRRVRLRRGVRRQPAVRRRPRAVDLRGRRRDALPQGHRPPVDADPRCSARGAVPCRQAPSGRQETSGQVRRAR